MALVKVQGIEVALGGDIYVIPPITLGALEQLQGRIGGFKGEATPDQVSTVIDCAYAAMRRNYPDMTRDQVAELIDLSNMMQVFEAVMDVSGLKRAGVAADAKAATV